MCGDEDADEAPVMLIVWTTRLKQSIVQNMTIMRLTML